MRRLRRNRVPHNITQNANVICVDDVCKNIFFAENEEKKSIKSFQPWSHGWKLRLIVDIISPNSINNMTDVLHWLSFWALLWKQTFDCQELSSEKPKTYAQDQFYKNIMFVKTKNNRKQLIVCKNECQFISFLFLTKNQQKNNLFKWLL